MDNLTEIYDELIMKHSINSLNKRKLDDANISMKGYNPNCGDEIVLELKKKGDIIEEMAFTGHGCAISQASTSIMIDVLRGKHIDEAKEIVEVFINMMNKEKLTEEKSQKIGDAIVLKKVLDMPSRVKCALIAWNTIYNILK